MRFAHDPFALQILSDLDQLVHLLGGVIEQSEVIFPSQVVLHDETSYVFQGDVPYNPCSKGTD